MTRQADTPSGDRRYGGASASERRAARYEQLIRAAIAIYAERGYRQATVSAICKEARLTPRYFYEAFDNSEALLAATFRGVTEFMMARIAEAGNTANGAPIDAMRATLAAYYELLSSERAPARVFLLEMADISPAIDALFSSSLDGFAALVLRTLPAGTSPSPLLLRQGATYGLLHIARSWVADGCRQPIGEVVDAALPLCLLLAGHDPA